MHWPGHILFNRDGMNLKQDKSNLVLIIILGMLLPILAYKEFEYHRFKRYVWNIGVVSSPDVTTRIISYEASSEKERYYEWGKTYYGNGIDIIYKQKAGNERLYCPYSKDEKRIYPEKVEIHWVTLEDDTDWKVDIELPPGYLKNIQKKRAPEFFGEPDFGIVAKMQPGGKVTMFLYANDQIRELGTWQGEKTGEKYTKILEMSNLPRHLQIALLINTYHWNGKLYDEREIKKPELIVRVERYSSQSYNDSKKEYYLPRMFDIVKKGDFYKKQLEGLLIDQEKMIYWVDSLYKKEYFLKPMKINIHVNDTAYYVVSTDSLGRYPFQLYFEKRRK